MRLDGRRRGNWHLLDCRRLRPGRRDGRPRCRHRRRRRRRRHRGGAEFREQDRLGLGLRLGFRCCPGAAMNTGVRIVVRTSFKRSISAVVWVEFSPDLVQHLRQLGHGSRPTCLRRTRRPDDALPPRRAVRCARISRVTSSAGADREILHLLLDRGGVPAQFDEHRFEAALVVGADPGSYRLRDGGRAVARRVQAESASSRTGRGPGAAGQSSYRSLESAWSCPRFPSRRCERLELRRSRLIHPPRMAGGHQNRYCAAATFNRHLGRRGNRSQGAKSERARRFANCKSNAVMA